MSKDGGGRVLGDRGFELFLRGGIPAVAEAMVRVLEERGVLDDNPEGRQKFCRNLAAALCAAFIQ